MCISPHPSRILFYILSTKCSPYQITRISISEVFNSILYTALNTSIPPHASNLELFHWVQAFDFTNLWCFKHPSERVYSHVSALHRADSWIDLAFGSRQMLVTLRAVSYLPAGISNYSPLDFVFDSGGQESTVCWRLDTKWIYDEKCCGRSCQTRYTNIGNSTNKLLPIWWFGTPSMPMSMVITSRRSNQQEWTRHLRLKLLKVVNWLWLPPLHPLLQPIKPIRVYFFLKGLWQKNFKCS